MVKVSFIVSFELPSGASRSEAAEYVYREVTAGCGGLHPSEPMFHLDRESVLVRSVLEEKKV